MDDAHEPAEPGEPGDLDNITEEFIGDLDDDITLDNIKQLVEADDMTELHDIQARVKARINQLLDQLDSEDRDEAWHLIHSLRNLAIARCNIEDHDPHRNFARLVEWAEEATDEDGNLKDEVAEQIRERRDDIDLDELVPHEDVKDEFSDDDTNWTTASYTELEDKHLEDQGRASLTDFHKWLLIQHHAGIPNLPTAPTLQKFEEAINDE